MPHSFNEKKIGTIIALYVQIAGVVTSRMKLPVKL